MIIFLVGLFGSSLLLILQGESFCSLITSWPGGAGRTKRIKKTQGGGPWQFTGS